MPWVICLLFLLHWTAADHFMGGTISYRVLTEYSTPDYIAVRFTFKFAEHRSESFCDDTTISNGLLLGEDNDEDDFWYCLDCPYLLLFNSSRNGNGTLAFPLPGSDDIQMARTLFQCTSFSDAEDWAAGENTFIVGFPFAQQYLVIHEECCFIRGLSVSGNCTYCDCNCDCMNCGSGLYPHYLFYTFFLEVDLTVVNDTGIINSSPITASVPLIRLRSGCSYAIPIHIDDPDGDPTACRRAVEPECGSVCHTGLNMDIDKTPGTPCVIRMTPLHMHPGYHPITLTIGEFNTTDWPDPDTAETLTTTPLKFIVDVIKGFGFNCGAKVSFQKGTLKGGTCNPIPANSTFITTIYIKEELCSRLVEVNIVGPIGIDKSNITGYGPYRKVTIRWQPKIPEQLGMHIFCFQALDDFGMYTEQRCVTLLVGAVAPKVLPHTASFNDTGEVPFNNTEFSILFDGPIRRPTVSRYIKILKIGSNYNNNTDTFVAIDTSVSSLINITLNTLTIFLPSNVSLKRHTTYLIIMEEGAVVGFPPCIGGGPPFLGLNNWMFTAVPLNICGDSYVDFDEECDDGSNVDNDGCRSNCTIEFAYRCNITTAGTSVCIRNECGDGQVFEPEEECDDSNINVGDGCGNTCLVEPGYQCQTLSRGTSLCINLCSNGVLDSNFEECDNGNSVIRDGCSDTTCQVLPLWICQSDFNETSNCEHVTVDFDSSNGSTLGLTVVHTTIGDQVYIADPSLLDASSFNNTDWSFIYFNLTGVKRQHFEQILYKPDDALSDGRLTEEQRTALRVSEQPGSTSETGSVTFTLKRQGEPVNLTHVLLSVVYTNDIPDFDPRYLIVQVFDNFNSAGAPAVITLQYVGENSNPPTVQAQGGPAQFTEKSADPVQLGQVQVNDSDYEVYKIQSATIAISASDVTPYEIVNTTAASTVITIWYNSSTGTLYLTGSASPARYQRVMSSATYFIRGEVGKLQDRSIVYTVNDGLHTANSSRKLILITVNDPPRLTVTTNEISYTEGNEPTHLPRATAFDPDTGKIERATIVLFHIDPDDILIINKSMASLYPHVTINVQKTHDQLTLELIGNASEVVYSHLLSGIAFHNNNSHPGNPSTSIRFINMSVFDGVYRSNKVQILVIFFSVNDPPTMQLSGTVIITQFVSLRERQANTSFTEDGRSIQLINESLVIYDIDSTNASRVTSVLHRALDKQHEKLTFNRTLASDLSLVLESELWLDNNTFKIVIVGNAPYSTYRKVLLSFKYANIKMENPITGDRFTTFTLEDDQGAVSDPLIIRITVLERNDPPGVDLGGGSGVIDSIIYREGDIVGVELLSHPHRFMVMLPDSAAISRITIELRASHGFELDEMEYIYPVELFPDTIEYIPALDGKSLVFTGNAPIEDFLSAVLSLRYANFEDEPTTIVLLSNGSRVTIHRTIIITVIDSGLRGLPPASTVAQVLVEIQHSNDNSPIISTAAKSDCISESSPNIDILLHGRSTRDISQFNTLQKAPEVSSIQLQGYNSTHLHPGSRLIIQFSNNTNLPSVAKASNLDNLFRVSPSTIASARQLAVWKDAATLLIVFQEDIHMPDTDLPMVHFTDPNDYPNIVERCKHHVCQANGWSEGVSGSYMAMPTLHIQQN